MIVLWEDAMVGNIRRMALVSLAGLDLGLTGCAVLPMGSANVTFRDNEYSLTSGNTFGVALGMDLDEARIVFTNRKNIRFSSRVCLLDGKDNDVRDFGRTSNIPCPDAYEEDAYDDNSLTNYGAYYIVAFRRKIIRIKFRPGAYIR